MATAACAPGLYAHAFREVVAWSAADEARERAREVEEVLLHGHRLLSRPVELHQAYEISSQVLGAGQFAKVFLCTSRQTGKKYACKSVQKKRFMYTQPKFEQNTKKEISILQRIKHPNIVQVVDVFDTANELNLIMERMSGGELFDYIIDSDSGRLEEEVSRGITEQVLQAVKYLHAENILHRDRKPVSPCSANV